MTSLEYLRKIGIEEDLDKTLFFHLILTIKHNGEICKKCGIIQGQQFKGFRKYYCEHLTKKIDQKLKKQKESVTMKIMDFVCQDIDITI
jgi:hypothetical protein